MVHNCALLNANKPSSSTERACLFVFMLQSHLYAKYIHPDGTVFSAFLVVWVVFFFADGGVLFNTCDCFLVWWFSGSWCSLCKINTFYRHQCKSLIIPLNLVKGFLLESGKMKPTEKSLLERVGFVIAFPESLAGRGGVDRGEILNS